MQKIIVLCFKLFRRVSHVLIKPFDHLFTCIVLFSSGVKFSSFTSCGIPSIDVALGGKCTMGPKLKMNNRLYANPIGRFQKCLIVVAKNGNLTIGENVGLSFATIVCHKRIDIGNHVVIGGNVMIYDTNFHSLNPLHRLNKKIDQENTSSKSVHIGKNVFIGAYSTILKGVTIGENSIVGACSVVTKPIPPNEVWAGNPAIFIKRNDC
jgi:acetyltransferase-like isoleucine patch superfamily enzyme